MSNAILYFVNDGSPSDGGWTRNVIDSTFDKARAVFATDIDNDGDIDVVGASYGDNDISWWENDGSEGFTERSIDSTYSNANSVYATDVDQDGDIDVLGAADTANDITWWENDGSPSNGGWTEHTVDGSFNTARDIHAIDLDKDGDIDILGASAGADKVVWWENSGSESFTERTIDSDFSSAYAIQAVDVDNDGDIDVIGAANGNNVNYDISWWENDGNPSDGGWTRNVIDSTFDKARAVFATDIDNDGDIDVEIGRAHV